MTQPKCSWNIVVAYAENRVYFPNEEWAPLACTPCWSSWTRCLLLELANSTPVRNKNWGPYFNPNSLFRNSSFLSFHLFMYFSCDVLSNAGNFIFFRLNWSSWSTTALSAWIVFVDLERSFQLCDLIVEHDPGHPSHAARSFWQIQTIATCWPNPLHPEKYCQSTYIPLCKVSWFLK